VATLAGVAERDAGLASGLNTAAFQIGGALGSAVVTTVAVSHVEGRSPAALTEGFQSAFVAAATFAAIGLVAAVTSLGRPRRRAEAPRDVFADPPIGERLP
jgi:predicted MFS family arabinose efflux permease